MTREELELKIQNEIEKGWIPSHLEDIPCSCHISPPCSRCCLDGDYSDEFCSEFDIEIIEKTENVNV